MEFHAYQGLETGSRETCTHVVKHNDVVLAFTCALNPGNEEFGQYLAKHGDGVRDIAMSVEDAKTTYERAVSRGAKSIVPPTELKDEFGSCIVATIQTYGDTWHSLIQNVDYTGPFLPGF